MVKAFLKKHSYLIAFFIMIAAMLIYIGFNYQLFIRLWLSIKHFGINVGYYFVTIYDRSSPQPPQVLDSLLAMSGGNVVSLLPLNFIAFGDKFIAFLAMLITGRNLVSSFSVFMTGFIKVLYFVNILALLLPILIIFNYIYFLPNKLAINSDSKPLKTYRKLVSFFYPMKLWFIYLYHFIFEKWYLKWSLIFCFFLMINGLPLIIDVISWYFYFVAAFDWSSIYKLLLVALIDLYDFFSFFHWSIYAIIAYFIFDSIRINRGYKILEHFENYDKGFIKSTGLVVMIDGTPGSGKTELMTDMVLSNDEILRDDVFGIMKEVDSLFPHFPFRLLEIDVEKGMADKLFHNRTHVTDYFIKKFNSKDFYGYDFDKYEEYAYVGLELEHISEALLDYAQAYFCYVMSCSFLLTNYSIRTDGVQIDNGHLKVWNYEFFRSDFKRFAYSKLSKNIPIDALRFGKQVIKDNPDSFVLDNCIVVFTEIDKDRLNTPNQQGLDINAEEANQRNDRFNDSLKTGRHPATIRHRTIYKFYGDTQRMFAVNADLRELSSTHIHVSSKNDFKIALPFYWIEPAICEWLLSLLEGIYYKFRVNRSDNTFLINLVRVLKSLVYKYYYKRLNTFGYWPLSLLVSDGSMKDEINVAQKYFLMKKKIHSDRYSSDAYSEFFAEKYRKAKRGFIDLAEYQSSKATPEELRYQKGYFIRILDREQESADDSFFNLGDDKQESVIVSDNLNIGDSAITL